uniref:Uncharacterized protein n=1 Tax=Arundo donax TaxID=35708 RepID=A0A0A9BI84_ARUDO
MTSTKKTKCKVLLYRAFGFEGDPVRNDPNLNPSLVAAFGLSHGTNQSVTEPSVLQYKTETHWLL